MPWEDIGECGLADAVEDLDRMVAEVRLGAAYVRLVCGEPPDGCKIGTMWHEHELGSYATVGLYWDPGEIEDAPWEYINRAAKAVSRFDDAVDWAEIEPEEGEDDADDCEDAQGEFDEEVNE